MKLNIKSVIMSLGLLIVLAAVLYSCGGGYGGGGMGGGTAAPGAFMLSSPTDGAMGVMATPMLTWTASSNVSDYRVQVELATGNFTGTLPVNTTVGATTYSYTVLASANLTLGTPYHWRVIAEGIYGSMSAGPFTFTP